MLYMGTINIVGTLTVIACIAVVLFALVLGMFTATRKKDEAKANIAAFEEALSAVNDRRDNAIRQAISAFGDGNPHTAAMTKLLNLRHKANTDKRRVAWTKKYMDVRDAFLSFATANSRPEMAMAIDMAKNELDECDSKVAAMEERLASAKEEYHSYEKPPKSYLISIGDKVLSFIVKDDDEHDGGGNADGEK